MVKKLECPRLVDGKPDCGTKEEDCPILNPEKFIEIKPGTLVVTDMKGTIGVVVGIVTKKKPMFPEEVYVQATKFRNIGERYSGLPLQKEDLIPLIELPEKLSEALSPEEALSMFTPRIVLKQARKLHELSERVNELSKTSKT